MDTVAQYQSIATTVPLSLRNNRDRLELPVTGLQEEAGRIGRLLATASGRLDLTVEQRRELQDRLADTLWYLALLCGESGVAMQDVAAHSIAKLQERTQGLDPDRR